MSTLTAAELESLWVLAGGAPHAAKNAAAVAQAESSGNTTAVNHDANGTTDTGLWQINSVHGLSNLTNPLANASAAVKISSDGKNWSPWCTAWSDGACGTKGGSPPPAGGLAPGSPAYRMLSSTPSVAASASTTGNTSGQATSATTAGFVWYEPWTWSQGFSDYVRYAEGVGYIFAGAVVLLFGLFYLAKWLQAQALVQALGNIGAQGVGFARNVGGRVSGGGGGE